MTLPKKNLLCKYNSINAHDDRRNKFLWKVEYIFKLFSRVNFRSMVFAIKGKFPLSILEEGLSLSFKRTLLRIK